MLSYLFIIDGILIGGERAPWAPPWLRLWANRIIFEIVPCIFTTLTRAFLPMHVTRMRGALLCSQHPCKT